MNGNENTDPQVTENRNLQKLAHVFDDGLSVGHLHPPVLTPRSMTALPLSKDEFKPPTLAPNTQTRISGKPIDIQTAKNLRQISLGYDSHSFTNDWKKFFFSFREIKSGIPYGLDASLPGPRALTLCVQAWVLKNLMFASDKDEQMFFGKESPKPSQIEQTNALVEALVDILWKAATPQHRNASQGNDNNQPEKKNVIIALVGFEPCFQTKRSFVEDGFTEKLWLFSMSTRQELKIFIKRNVHYLFCWADANGSAEIIQKIFCNRIYPAAIMLLYSVILSRTFDVIMKDMGRPHMSLLTDNARSTQVGSMYKTPLFPIWVTQVNGTFGLLFCTARDLVTDWKTERLFNLHYFNGHFTQKEETILTLDTRTRVETINPDRQITIWDDEEEKEKKQPSLENLIFTKWPGAEIDWNGESPYY